ncbi:histidine kinase [Ancylomarina euxinus]|uniref:Histidine kinase n=1 Tax=Ancylomarina euxinus TaxID=2283627 RepID=A0A425Y650_9BACT|nr:sensor histidine kinase [Ancylomarina euxinus]MCZ4694137.1 sensor histidine kinase [Ancylomarina euxinus]MUP15803.1 histidine kinase [Ancylomarina euxinus]RRG23993.1 histidine kinase [Ancylomarina euxinus]
MINQIKNNGRNLIQNRLVQHLLFWMFSFYTLVHFFALQEDISKIDVVYTALFHISLVFGVYANVLLLIPYLLKLEKYSLYIIAIIGTWLAIAYTNQFTFTHLSDWLTPDYLFISVYDIKDLLKFSFVYLFIITLLKLSKSWFTVLETQKELEIVKREQVESELSALKSNINPHFLFNNLNSLYALSRKNAKETPDYILKLSELMRYMIYETQDKLVFLEKEINYITNYLDLQKLRCQSDTFIHYKIEGKINSQQIAPFLLIPFIENCFKHGGMNQSDSNFIDLEIQIESDRIHMNLNNSIPTKPNKQIVNEGGFGIENVKKRLNSLYQNKHELSLELKQELFKVELNLNLKR